VRVVTTGKLPRRALRYALANKRRRTFSTTETFSPRLSVNGRSTPGSAALEFEASGTLRFSPAVDRAGHAQRQLEVARLLPNSAALEPEDLIQLQTHFATFEGVTLVGDLSERGEAPTVVIELPHTPGPDAEAYLRRLSGGLMRLFPRLPEDALGLGARFVVEHTVPMDGTDVLEKTTYTVERLGVGTVRLHIDGEERALAGTLTGPEGRSVQLDHLTGSDRGYIDLDLAGLRAHARIDSHLVISTHAVATTQESAVRSSVTTDLVSEMRVEGR
jgi:hypothetical protein